MPRIVLELDEQVIDDLLLFLEEAEFEEFDSDEERERIYTNTYLVQQEILNNVEH